MPEVTEKKKSSESAAPAPGTSPAKEKAPGLQFRRLFTKPGISPYDEIEWDLRVAQITDGQGNVIFEQKDVEVPSGKPECASWWLAWPRPFAIGARRTATSAATKTRPCSTTNSSTSCWQY